MIVWDLEQNVSIFKGKMVSDIYTQFLRFLKPCFTFLVCLIIRNQNTKTSMTDYWQFGSDVPVSKLLFPHSVVAVLLHRVLATNTLQRSTTLIYRVFYFSISRE